MNQKTPDLGNPSHSTPAPDAKVRNTFLTETGTAVAIYGILGLIIAALITAYFTLDIHYRTENNTDYKSHRNSFDSLALVLKGAGLEFDFHKGKLGEDIKALSKKKEEYQARINDLEQDSLDHEKEIAYFKSLYEQADGIQKSLQNALTSFQAQKSTIEQTFASIRFRLLPNTSALVDALDSVLFRYKHFVDSNMNVAVQAERKRILDSANLAVDQYIGGLDGKPRTITIIVNEAKLRYPDTGGPDGIVQILVGSRVVGITNEITDSDNPRWDAVFTIKNYKSEPITLIITDDDDFNARGKQQFIGATTIQRPISGWYQVNSLLLNPNIKDSIRITIQ